MAMEKVIFEKKDRYYCDRRGTFLSRKMYRICLSLEILLKNANEAVNINILSSMCTR